MDSLAIPTAVIGPEPVEAAGVIPAASGSAASGVFTAILADILPTPDAAASPAELAVSVNVETAAGEADGLMVAALTAASAQAQKGVQAAPENPAAGLHLVANAPAVTPVELTTEIISAPVEIPSVEAEPAPETSEKPAEINPVLQLVTEVTQVLEQGPKVEAAPQTASTETAPTAKAPAPEAAPVVGAEAPAVAILPAQIEAPAVDVGAETPAPEAPIAPVATLPAPVLPASNAPVAPVLTSAPQAPAEITLIAEAPAPAPQLQVRVIAPAKMERVETATVTLLETPAADDTIRAVTQLFAAPASDKSDETVASDDDTIDALSDAATDMVEAAPIVATPLVVDPAIIATLTQLASHQKADAPEVDMSADERLDDNTPRHANLQAVLARAQLMTAQTQAQSAQSAAAPAQTMQAPVVRAVASSDARALVLPTSDEAAPQFSIETPVEGEMPQAYGPAPRAVLVGGKSAAPEMILRSDTELAPVTTGGHDIRDLAKFDVREIEVSLANRNDTQSTPAPQAPLITEQVSITSRGTSGEQAVTASVSYSDDKSRAAANEVRLRTLERMVINAAREGSDTIKMQLYPPGLGQIVLRLSMEGNRLRLTGRTSSAEAVDAMRDIEHGLRDALATGGLQLTDFDVSDDNDQSGEHQRPRQDAKSTTGGSFETEAFAIDMNA